MADLNPFQVESYRYVMYEIEKEKREFWVDIIQTVVKELMQNGALHLANLIVAKMVMALNSEDFMPLGGEHLEENQIQPSNDFFKDLVEATGGLSPEDIKNLQNAGINLGELTQITGEDF